MKKPIVALLLTVGGVLALSGGFLAYRTLSNTGEAAVEAMSVAERAFLAKLQRVSGKMSYDEVVDLLGSPDRSGAGVRPTWRGPGGSPLSQAAVYFGINGTARKVRWLKIGCFVWEVSL